MPLKRNIVVRAFQILSFAVAAIPLYISCQRASAPSQPATFQERANTFSHLPPEAKILFAREGKWGESEDGNVEFTLPETHSVGDWLDTVWRLNSYKDGFLVSTEKYARHAIGDDGSKFRNLSYDPKSRIYDYSRLTIR